MLTLALDTSAAAGSAALLRDGRVVGERAGDGGRTHGERLPRELMALLESAGVTLRDIDRFAVSTGPGSFTGLRVGIATIQGLALAQHKLVVPVSSFEALAFVTSRTASLAARAPDFAAPPSRLVAPWIDAHRGEVFAALYAADARTVLQPPSSLKPEATLDAWAALTDDAARVHFAGDGALEYADVIRAHLGERAIIESQVPVLAGAIAEIAAADPDRAVAPHALVPLYVRRSDAELARDRRQAGQARQAKS